MNTITNERIQYGLRLFALAAVYALVAKVVLSFFAANHLISIIWPSSGVALAALLLGGWKYWPGVMLGAFLGNWLPPAGNPASVCLAIAVGNTLEALAGYTLIKRTSADIRMAVPRDYTLLALTAVSSSLISALNGVATIYWAGFITADQLVSSLVRWWQGDVFGIVLVTPLLLVWRHWPARRLDFAQALRIIACYGLALVSGQMVFFGWMSEYFGVYAQKYWAFFFVSWATVRFGRHGVLVMIFMIVIQALLGVVTTFAPGDVAAVEEELGNLWFYFLVLTMVGLTQALIIHARTRAHESLRESEERWQFALEGSGDGVWDWDISEDKVYLSSVFQQMYGYGEHFVEANPQAWSKLVHPDDMQQVLKDFEDHLAGKTADYRNEHRVRCSNGEYKWILDRGIVVRRDDNGKPLRMVGTHTDITRSKEAENSLQNINETLEARVAARTEELERARLQAESATRAKSEFLANMSHEVRTPISNVLGMSSLVLATDLSQKQRDYLEKIQLSGKHLLALVDDLLDFSKIEAGKLMLERIDFSLAVVLDTVRMMFEEQARKKGIELVVDIDSRIDTRLQGDPLRLGQILINYVDNAIKFSDKGRVTVKVFVIATSDVDCLLRFEVHDEGIGIAAEQKRMLFRSFQQADASISRKYGGTGLGLAISRQLAEMMGGQAGAESRVNSGSTFWFTVRLAKSSEAAAQEIRSASAPLAAEDAGLRGARVLVVEDNAFNQQVASELLEMAGAEVVLASDGGEAVRLLRQQAFDCVLMDVQMPVMDGLQATRIIRADPALADTLIIAMTANAWSEDRERCLEAGMDDFLSKPVRPEQLRAVISQWLAQGRQTAIDKAALVACCGGNMARGMELAAKFLVFTRTDITHLRSAIASGDVAAVRALGHKMKSGARQIGAMSFGGICESLERMEANNMAYADSCLTRLEKLLDKIAQQLDLNS